MIRPDLLALFKDGLHEGHAENNEVWQNGRETWKMNTHFDAPASYIYSRNVVVWRKLIINTKEILL